MKYLPTAFLLMLNTPSANIVLNRVVVISRPKKKMKPETLLLEMEIGHKRKVLAYYIVLAGVS
jgi:hypothetical protein